MFFTRSSILLFLVFQLHQIAAEGSCGVNSGPLFRVAMSDDYRAQESSWLNAPWTTLLFCKVEGKLKKIVGAVISKRYALFLYLLVRKECNNNITSSYVSVYDTDGKRTTMDIEAFKTSEKAPNILLVKMKNDIPHDERAMPVCLPDNFEPKSANNKKVYTLDSDNDEIIRTIQRGPGDCHQSPSENNEFQPLLCSSYFNLNLDFAKLGQAVTFNTGDSHVLLGLVPKQQKTTRYFYYTSIKEDLDTIHELMRDEDVNNAGSNNDKLSTIFEVVNKHANK